MDQKKLNVTVYRRPRGNFKPPRRISQSDSEVGKGTKSSEAQASLPSDCKKKRDVSPIFAKMYQVIEERCSKNVGESGDTLELKHSPPVDSSDASNFRKSPPSHSQAEITDKDDEDTVTDIEADKHLVDEPFDAGWKAEGDEEDLLFLEDYTSKQGSECKIPSNLITQNTSIFKSPFPRTLHGRGSKSNFNAQQEPEEENSSSQSQASQSDNKRFYEAVYAKVSTRKHKKFDNDGYIIVSNGTCVTLKSTSGKVIERCANFKIDSEMLEEGKVFKLGSKEVQISDPLPSDPFATDVKLPVPDPVAIKAVAKLPVPLLNKPFVPPVQPGSVSNNIKPNKNPAKPMFDPDMPDALVLPTLEPSEDVRVVVDPHLSRHLREHQREGVTFLYKCSMDKYYNGAILGDEMGLGKTLQCITLLWTLLKQGPYQRKEIVKRALIVAPSSLVNNWEKEFHRWLGHERLTVFAVNSDHPLKHYPPQCPVIILSYEMATRCEDALKKMRFDIIVCDEAHKIKNKNAQAYLFLSKLLCRRRILLTGTPVQNDLMELYALVDFANPGVLGSEPEFRRDYAKPIEKYQESHSTIMEKQNGQAKALQLNNILNNFFLRRTHNVMIRYLPPRVTFVVICKPSNLQVHLYKQFISLNVVQDCVTGSNSCSTPLSMILALKKLCNHPNLVHPKTNNAEKVDESIYSMLGGFFPQGHRHDLLRVEDSGKMKVLIGLLKNIQAQKEKVVLVSHYTQTLDILEDACKMFSFQFKRLDGSTVSKQRQQIVDQFNNGINEFIFLLSSKAGGLGLNLQGASNIILYDIDWNPAHDIQAMSRCWRPGQRKITNIFRLITSGSIEERIYHRQIAKQDLSGSVMDLLLSNSNVKFSPQDLKDIFSFYEGENCLTHELIECDCSMDGTLRELNTSIHLDIDDNSDTENEHYLAVTAPPKKKLKSLSTMAELNSWEHHGPPFCNLAQDGLQAAAGSIKFVFCSRSLPSEDS